MTIFQFWSSNSAQLSSHPTSCKLVTVFIIMFFTCVVRLTHMFHVWVPRRRLYDSSALHIVGGIIHISSIFPFPPQLYTFPPSCPRGFLQEKLRLRQSLVLFYAAIGIYHWILFAMLYTLRKIFHQSTSVASYWQKTDIIHMNTKA